MPKTKILIVDDSLLIRSKIRDKINSDPDLEVIGEAKNGEEALELTKKISPDVITMDIMMPVMNGLEATKRITKEKPTPILIITSIADNEVKESIQALESGAVDVLIKSEELFSKESKKLVEKIKQASKAQILKIIKVEKPESIAYKKTENKLIVIASSTGGPQTIEKIITQIPQTIHSPIIIVQHMPPIFTKSFADRLNSISKIKVKEAEDNEVLKQKTVYIAPGDYHLELKESDAQIIILLNQKEKVNSVRPSADITFDSASKIFKEKLVGVILTGMGHDGTNGAKMIKTNNGTVIVQSLDSSIIPGMPKSVIDSGNYDEIVPLEMMASAITQLAGA